MTRSLTVLLVLLLLLSPLSVLAGPNRIVGIHLDGRPDRGWHGQSAAAVGRVSLDIGDQFIPVAPPDSSEQTDPAERTLQNALFTLNGDDAWKAGFDSGKQAGGEGWPWEWMALSTAATGSVMFLDDEPFESEVFGLPVAAALLFTGLVVAYISSTPDPRAREEFHDPAVTMEFKDGFQIGYRQAVRNDRALNVLIGSLVGVAAFYGYDAVAGD